MQKRLELVLKNLLGGLKSPELCHLVSDPVLLPVAAYGTLRRVKAAGTCGSET